MRQGAPVVTVAFFIVGSNKHCAHSIHIHICSVVFVVVVKYEKKVST